MTIPDDLAPAAIALAEALRSDPFYETISQSFAADETRRVTILVRYFEYSMREGACYGRLVVCRDAALGAAVWLLPLDAFTSLAQREAKNAFLEDLLGAAGFDAYRRIVAFMHERASARIAPSAWYLSIVGVAPAGQGRGIGARLLEPTLAEADVAGVACYLETFNSRNPSFYQRVGFVSIGTYAEPVTGATYTIMHRTATRAKCIASASKSPA